MERISIKLIPFLILFIGLFSSSCNKTPALQIEENCEPLDLVEGEWHFLGLTGEEITSIVVDPTNNCTIYAGSSSNFSAGTKGALFKSSNGGMTWTTLFDQISVANIAIDPLAPNTIYATLTAANACPPGVLKTTDCGLTWRFVNRGIRLNWETSVVPITIHPKLTNIIFVGTGAFGAGGLYKSTNGGESWEQMLEDSLSGGPTAIAIDPKVPQIIYVAESMGCRLWKTDNGGRNWHVTGLEARGLIRVIRFDPLNPNTVYCIVGRKGLFVSRNKGETWEPFGSAIDSTRYAQRLFLINPFHSDEMFIGTGIYGVFRSLDRGITWNQINEGLENLWVQELAIGGNGTILYGGVSINIYEEEGGIYGRRIHMINPRK